MKAEWKKELKHDIEMHAQGTIRKTKEDPLSHLSRKIEQSPFSNDIAAIKKPERFQHPVLQDV